MRVVVAVAVGVIGAGLGFERFVRDAKFEAHPGEHGVEDVVVAVAQPVRPELQRDVPVAQMVGAASQQSGLASVGGRDGFTGREDLDDAAVLGAQAVPAAQNLAPRQDDTDLLAVLEARAEAAAAAHIEGQHQPRARRPGRIGRCGAPPDQEQGRIQNKKYRCARGSTRAGSQVSSCPSARTS